MTALDVFGLGWVALILISYSLIGRYGVRQFHWANVLAALPLTGVAFSVGAYANGVLSVAFGLIGAWNLLGEGE